jgi:hypothetical protein
VFVGYDVGFSATELNATDGFADDCLKHSASSEADLLQRRKKNKNNDIQQQQDKGGK